MPSIIGNTTITGAGGSMTGPQGNAGPRGATGSSGIGNTGGTGNTGAYVKLISFNPGVVFSGHADKNELYFSLTDGNTLTVVGITGATGTYSNLNGVTGISTPFNNIKSNFSFFKRVDSGKTLEFRGICGAGTISVAIDPNDTRIINATINPSASSTSYGNTGTHFLLYTTETYTATATRVGITGSKNTLSIGLTADDGATGSRVKVYSDFIDNIYNISSVSRTAPTANIDAVITSVDSDGLVVNLNKYSTYKIQTPVGVSRFDVTADSNEIRSYTMFIEGSDVWNFPSNVYFENTEKGLGGYGFLSGTNIVHLWTANGGLSFNANIIERGLGYAGPFYNDSVGSCCYDNNTRCIEYVTPEECAQTFRGAFSPGKICSESCGVFKSCCVDGSCYNNIEESICIQFGGVPKTEPCTAQLCQVDQDGACCQGFGICQNTNASGCASLGGHFTPNKNCNEIDDKCGPNEQGLCGDPDLCSWYNLNGQHGGQGGGVPAYTTKRWECENLVRNQQTCAPPRNCKLTEWILDYKFYPKTILPGLTDNVWPQPNLKVIGADGVEYDQTNSIGCFNGHCCALEGDADCAKGRVNSILKYNCSAPSFESKLSCLQKSIYPWYDYWHWTKNLGQTCGDLGCTNVFNPGNGDRPCWCCTPEKTPNGQYNVCRQGSVWSCYFQANGTPISTECPEVFIPEWGRNERICPEAPGSPIPYIPPASCVGNCNLCHDLCLGVCCFGNSTTPVNMGCFTCKQLGGVFFAGFNAADNINPCIAIADGGQGKCCRSGNCTVTSFSQCDGQWYFGEDCSEPCPDVYEYVLNVIDDPTNRNVLDNVILQKAPNPGVPGAFIYKAEINLFFSTNSPFSVNKVILPSTISVPQLPPGSSNIVVQKIQGQDNNTLYADQAVIPVTITFDPWIDPNQNGTFQGLGPIYLQITTKNGGGTTVLTKSVPVYFNSAPETERGCRSCSVDPTTKFKLQIRANMQRYCTDCEKWNPTIQQMSPSVLKEQQVIANVCLAKVQDCGWGITLDSAVYSSINNVWDCTYGPNDVYERLDPAQESLLSCPDIQSGVDSQGNPYSEFNPRPIPTNGSGGPDISGCFPSVTWPYSAEFSNYFRQNCNVSATNRSTNANISFKGETKIALPSSDCPNGRSYDPYYNTIEFSPETYSKLAKYEISKENIKILLDDLGQKLLTLQNNDGGSNPKMAFNPARQNQAVRLNTNVDIVPCTGDALFNNVNGNAIFKYTPTANEVVKYFLILSKKTNTFKTELEYKRIRQTNVRPPEGLTGVDGCISAYNWGVVRLVANSSNSYQIDASKICSTKLLNGDSDFGNTVVSITLNRNENKNGGLFTSAPKLNVKELLSGIPCGSSSLYLIGEIDPIKDLDLSDPNNPKLKFINNSNYAPDFDGVLVEDSGLTDPQGGGIVYFVDNRYTNTCSDLSQNGFGVIYEPEYLAAWKSQNRIINKNGNSNIFSKLPSYTPFSGTRGLGSGATVARVINRFYLNTIECNSESIDCPGSSNSCLKTYDQYSYKNCFLCSPNSLTKYNYTDIFDKWFQNYISVGGPIVSAIFNLFVRPINACKQFGGRYIVDDCSDGIRRQNLQYNVIFGAAIGSETGSLDYLNSLVLDNELATQIRLPFGQHLDLGLRRNMVGWDGINYDVSEIKGTDTPGLYFEQNDTIAEDLNNENSFLDTSAELYKGFIKVPFQFDTTRPGNPYDQYYSVESCAYLTGNDIAQVFFDFNNYGDVPVINAHYTHDPNTINSEANISISPITAVPAIISNPHVNAKVFVNGNPSTITVYPNVVLNSQQGIGLSPELETLTLEGWLVKDLHLGSPEGAPISDQVLPSATLQQKIINERFTTIQDSLNFTIPNIAAEWAPRINGESLMKLVFKMRVVVKILDNTGIPIVNGDGTPMERTITRIFTVRVKPSNSITGPDPSEEFPADNILIKTKNIDGVCVNIDCTNNLLFCNTLEDC